MTASTAPSPERRQRYRRGLAAERLAAWLLVAKGYRILARRYRTPVGEIDIIARRGRSVAFVEVKRRGSLDDATRSITPASQRRQTRAAKIWLQRHPRYSVFNLRFDVVLLAPRRWPRHLVDAFPARS